MEDIRFCHALPCLRTKGVRTVCEEEGCKCGGIAARSRDEDVVERMEVGMFCFSCRRGAVTAGDGERQRGTSQNKYKNYDL